MSDPRYPDGGCRPTRSQELLLRAALLSGEPALAAWREWRSREELERLDSASNGLVGLLWRNLDSLGVEHETMARLKGVYRHAWFANQNVLRHAGAPLRVLREAGIPTLALKGAGLCALYYRDWGVRKMEDLDLLVPPSRALDALAALGAAGCEPEISRAEERLPYRHSVGLSHPDGWELDLHWFSLWRSSSDEQLWSAAVPLSLAGEETLAPGPTHQLLHVCAHGADWNEVAPIRWVADAAAVLHAGEVDWDLFEREARSRLLTVALASGLGYLRSLLEAPVPEDVVARLRSARAPRFERAGLRVSTLPHSRRRSARVVWERYRRMSRLRPEGPRPGLLGSYYDLYSLQWGVERPVDLAAEALRRSLRIAGRQLRPRRGPDSRKVHESGGMRDASRPGET